MRGLFLLLVQVVLVVPAWAGQPFGIKLDPNGVSLIYPVFESNGWVLTQPSARDVHNPQGNGRVTHWGDDFFAQDWARGCGQTQGQRLYAGISGQVVLAGARGPYGWSVVIYDPETRFALKYSHLSEILVQGGEYVLAGQSLVGRVGNTGNVQASACTSNPGSHLHLSLHKNVSNPTTRPITTTSASNGSGPTTYAAPFGYAASVDLMKTADNPTVYAKFYGTRVPITAASWESHGWGFDKNQSVFNPLAGKVISLRQLGSIPEAYYFYPFRDYALIKAEHHPAVFQFEEGEKQVLSGEVFACRGNRFGEVITLSGHERDLYPPGWDKNATGCITHLQQALRDFPRYYQLPNLVNQPLTPDWSTYGRNLDWDPSWELRWIQLVSPNGARITVYHATFVSEPIVRVLAYSDGVTGEWFGWQAVQ